MQPRYLAKTLELWITTFKNIFFCLLDLFYYVRLSLDMWHLFSCKVNVNNPAKLWVYAFGVCLLNFKLTNMVGGQ